MCMACREEERGQIERLRTEAHAEGRTQECPSGFHHFAPDDTIACSCFRCGGCEQGTNTDTTAKCEVCGQCENCDKCRFCVACENKVKTRCDDCEKCERCCECVNCGACGGKTNPNNFKCSVEQHCKKCCKHKQCGNCYRRYKEEDFCQRCNACYDNCCGGASELCRNYNVRVRHRKNKGLKFHESTFAAGEFRKNKLTRFLSCEIEVSNQGRGRKFDGGLINEALNEFDDSVVSDGSLRGWQPFEINTQPANGDKFVNHIQKLAQGLKDMGAEANDSCGVHVHVNTKDYTTYDLRKLLGVYAKTERAFFELCKPSRINYKFSLVCGANWFCTSRDPKAFRSEILGKLYNSGKRLTKKNETKEYATTMKERRGVKAHETRYRALNVHSHFMRGTVEFRHHQGTVDSKELVNWALVCGWMVENSLRLTDAAIENLPTNPYRALLEVIPPSLHGWLKEKWAAWETEWQTDRADYDHIWADQEAVLRAAQFSVRAEREREALNSILEGN